MGQTVYSIVNKNLMLRYGADYVNKLYRGIMKNTTKKVVFYCFTDDVSDLLLEI